MADSPDPLTSSLFALTTPTRSTRSSTKAIHSSAPRIRSAGKSMRMERVERSESRQSSLESPYKESHIITSSPSKTPGARGGSPWRIRVTVEAEPEESDNQNGAGGLGEMVEAFGVNDPTDSLAESFDSPLSRGRTTTTIVPLKGLDSSPEPSGKKGRGRPRKSGTPVKRLGTPVAKRRLSKANSPAKKDVDMSYIASEQAASAYHTSELDVESTNLERSMNLPTARTKRRGRRKEISPVHIAMDSETGSDGVDWLEASRPLGMISVESALRDVQLNQVATSDSGVDQSTDKGSRNSSQELENDYDEHPDLAASKFSPAKKTPTKQILSLNAPNASNASNASNDSNKSISDPFTKESESRVNQDVQEEPVPQTAAKRVAFLAPPPRYSKPEGTEDRTSGFREFDSIMESEGFSMISTASLPSVKEHLNSPPQDNPPQSNPPQNSIASTNKPQSADASKDTRVNNSRVLSLPTPEDSSPLPEDHDQRTKNMQTDTWVNRDVSSIENPEQSVLGGALSSPPARVLGYQKPSSLDYSITPFANHSSPSMPPPLQVATVNQISQKKDKTQSTASISPVVRAGKSLQSALVNTVGSVLGSPFSSPVKSRKLDDTIDPFSGFSQKTRRELGAGLKLGESIAHEKSSDTGTPVFESLQEQDDVFGLPGSTPAQNSGFDKVRYPSLGQAVSQLPSPAKSADSDADAMDWTRYSISRHLSELGSKKSSSTPLEEQNDIYMKMDQNDYSRINHSTLEDREMRWQRERERVSQSINQASSDEVVVIESSDFDEEDDGKDAQDTASTAFYGRKTDTVQTFLPSPQPGPLVSTLPTKPARGKIPSPWRRGRDSSIVYSDEVLPPSSPSKILSTIDESIVSLEETPKDQSRFLHTSNFTAVAPTDYKNKPAAQILSESVLKSGQPPVNLPSPDCISNGRKIPSTVSWQSNHYAALNYLWRKGGKKTSPILPFVRPSTPMEPVTDSESLFYTVSSTDSILGSRVTDGVEQMEISQVEIGLVDAFRLVCEERAVNWNDWYILGHLFAIVVDARNKRVERRLRPNEVDVSGFLHPIKTGHVYTGEAVVADQPLPDGEGNCVLM